MPGAGPALRDHWQCKGAPYPGAFPTRDRPVRPAGCGEPEALAANLDLHEPGLDQDRALNANHLGDPRLWSAVDAAHVEFWIYAMRSPAAHARLVEHQRRLLGLVAELFERQCARYDITPAASLDELAAPPARG